MGKVLSDRVAFTEGTVIKIGKQNATKKNVVLKMG